MSLLPDATAEAGATIEQLSLTLVKYETVPEGSAEPASVPRASGAIKRHALVPFERQADRTREILAADTVLEHLFPTTVVDEETHTISRQVAGGLDVIALQEQLEQHALTAPRRPALRQRP